MRSQEECKYFEINKCLNFWIVSKVSIQSLVKLKSVKGQFMDTVSGVYGPNVDANKKCLWEELEGVLVGDECHGVLKAILMWLIALVRDWAREDIQQLCGSSQISVQNWIG